MNRFFSARILQFIGIQCKKVCHALRIIAEYLHCFNRGVNIARNTNRFSFSQGRDQGEGIFEKSKCILPLQSIQFGSIDLINC